MRKILTLLALILTSSLWAQIDFCTKELETYPTRSGGRVKPVYVLATETIKFISGESKVGELTATEAFCKLSLKAFGMPLEIPIQVRVDHVEVKKLLGMNEGDHTIPIQTLIDKSSLLDSELVGLKENNSYKKELNKVKQRLQAYDSLVLAKLWTIPSVKGKEVEFIPMADFLTQDKIMSIRSKSDNPVKYIFAEAKNLYVQKMGEHYLLELTYFKINFFFWALLASLISIILLVAIKIKWPGIVFTIITISLQLSAMIMRIMISGRAPVTNMYETVMFSGFGALIISCIITIYRKEFAFLIAGLAFNVLSLMMMKFANNMLDAGISPLVPVLRDNFWLSTHVTTVILSYAALALSWLIANGLMVRDRFFNVSSAEYRYGVDLVYTCIKFGVVLLAAGIILGGVWADYSWGRFWGWDPKETWSLIVLLVYMAILHGKSTSWIPPHRFIPMVAGAFMTVMMAWFGVNYILASGLHSYGFSEGGAIFLGSFFAIQIVLILLSTIKNKKLA